MAGPSDRIYAFRVMRLPLLEPSGSPIGQIRDIVLLPPTTADAPRVLGFVAESQRRRIFVNAARIAELDNGGARLRSSEVDVNPFKRRPGEVLVSADLIDKKVGAESVDDVILRPAVGRSSAWEVANIRLVAASRSPLRRRRGVRLVEWREVATLFGTDPMAAEAAALRDLHPSDVAAKVRGLPLQHRRQLAAAMDDERLADLLEELPESEQLRLIETLDLDRLVSVLEEMEYDEAADLLAEMPGEQRTRVLDAMDAEDAEVYRRLLQYEDGTAGAIMAPDPVMLGANATVAEALARIRDPELGATIAAQVFVTRPPWVTPTGRYLGVVHFQRLLREPPSTELGSIVEEEPTVPPDLTEREVAERLAAYNLLSIAVCDEQRRLLGVITVDDVLDRTLPAGWRQRQRLGSRQ